MRINRVFKFIGEKNNKYKYFIKGELNDNNQKNGYWEEYWDYGIVKTKGSYVNGIRDGLWLGYWFNGNLHSIGYYKNNHKLGDWVYYRENGVIKYKKRHH